MFLLWLILKDRKELEVAQNWLDDQLREIENDAKSGIDGKISEKGFRIKCTELEIERFGNKIEIALDLLRKNDKKQKK